MSKKHREELKKLESIKSTLEAELESLKVEEKNIKEEIGNKKNLINNITQKINNLVKSKSDLIISEHAIIRYIERVMKIDIEEINKMILPEDAVSFVKKNGDGKFPINDGQFMVVIKNGVIVTVITNENEIE